MHDELGLYHRKPGKWCMQGGILLGSLIYMALVACRGFMFYLCYLYLSTYIMSKSISISDDVRVV